MTGTHRRTGLRLNNLCIIVIPALAICCSSCGKRPDDGADSKVTTLGSFEVTAQLTEIRGLEQWKGNFPSNDLGYDYVYILKYRVLESHRGKVDGDTILVGHYNPLKPRAHVVDARVEQIGGNLKKFRTGDIHRMALQLPLDDYYMGPIINKYFKETQGKGPYYWAVWTNQVIR